MKEFEFTRTYEGYQLHGTYECERDGTGVELTGIRIGDSEHDAVELIRKGVLDWVTDSLRAEAFERVEDERLEYTSHRHLDYA